MNKVALTVDLEFLEETYSGDTSLKETARFEKKGIQDLLNELETEREHLTFFTVASLCDNHVSFLKEIRDQGHEIACHSCTHSTLTAPDANLEKEIKESKNKLEKNLGVDVKGFRSPALDFNEQVLEKIVQADYIYDSSEIHSFKIPGWYGGSDEKRPYDRNGITEIPVSANPLLKTPISGFFIRALGRKHLYWSINSLQKRGIVPVLYIHPYELTAFSPKRNWRQKLRAGDYMKNTIKRLIREYDIIKVEELLN